MALLESFRSHLSIFDLRPYFRQQYRDAKTISGWYLPYEVEPEVVPWRSGGFLLSLKVHLSIVHSSSVFSVFPADNVGVTDYENWADGTSESDDWFVLKFPDPDFQ